MIEFADIMLIITGLYTVASVIVRLTPTRKDDAVLAKIKNILDVATNKQLNQKIKY